MVLFLGAEVYERLNKRREDDNTRKKMLDDIVVHIQVMTEIYGELLSLFRFPYFLCLCRQMPPNI